MSETVRSDIAKRMGEYRNKAARAPFASEGIYELRLKTLRKKAEEKTVDGRGPDGRPAKFTTEVVDSYFLEGEVLTSNTDRHPVGSSLAVYFDMKPGKYASERDEEGLWNLFCAVLECVDKLPGANATAEQVAEVEKLYAEFKADPKFAEDVRIGLECRTKKERKGDPTAFTYKNWTPIRGQGAASKT